MTDNIFFYFIVFCSLKFIILRFIIWEFLDRCIFNIRIILSYVVFLYIVVINFIFKKSVAISLISLIWYSWCDTPVSADMSWYRNRYFNLIPTAWASKQCYAGTVRSPTEGTWSRYVRLRWYWVTVHTQIQRRCTSIHLPTLWRTSMTCDLRAEYTNS